MAVSGHMAEREVLLAEYREAMESHRANTNLIYSWTGSIFLVLATALFVLGVNAEKAKIFFPVMALAIVLIFVWWGLTETFVFYIRQRLQRIREIEQELGMRLMSEAGKEIQSMGWKAKLVEARSYVRGSAILYAVIWFIMAWVKF